MRVTVICPGFIDTEIADNATYRGIDPVKQRAKLPFEFATPQLCAEEALAGVERNEAEVVITRHARGLVALHRVSPRAARAMARVQAAARSS